MKTGISFPMALFLLFLGLKLGQVIDWSWWWVTCPLWIPPAILIGLGLIVVLVLGTVALTAGIVRAIQE